MFRELKLLSDSFFADFETKHYARYRIVKRLADIWGFKVYQPELDLSKNSEYREALAGYHGLPYSYNAKKFSLFHYAKGIRNVAGDTVECGVYRGRGSYLILKGTNRTDKIHHIFDSFDGISTPGENDKPDDLRIKKWAKCDKAASLEDVHSILKEFPNVKYYKGWIPERFPEVTNRTFSLVHIDVDLYQPTRASVAFFYDRMTQGEMIICDDYGFSSCPGAKKAMDEYFADKPENVMFVSNGVEIVIKQ